jgi:hypothetical protein
MTAALHQIASSDEMKPLLNRARKAGRGVLIEVFQSRDGQPILIHTALLPRLGEQKESA